MAAGKVDLYIEQGAPLDRKFIKKRNGVPDDLTGYTAKMQIRPEIGSATVLITLTSTLAAGSGIVLGGVAGTIQILISPTATSGFTVPEDGGKLGVYDLFLTLTADPTKRPKILRGFVFIAPEVTAI